MKRVTLILIGLIQSCSAIEQNDFIEVKNLGQTTSGSVIYRLYQTGFDNYRFEFFLVDQGDTNELFQTYLNDTAYQSVDLFLDESDDSIKIKSNRELGQSVAVINNKIFLLTRKIEPFKGFAFESHTVGHNSPNLMIYRDSISWLTDLELSMHKKIWNLEEVDQVAKDLRSKDVISFTLIEKYPTDSVNFYTIRFGKAMKEHLQTISYYRIEKDSGLIEILNEVGDWERPCKR